MSNLAPIDLPLVGGVEKLELAPVSWVAFFAPLRGLSLPASEIALKEGRQWLDVPAVDDSLIYEEPAERGAQGLLYNKILRGFLPHDAPEHRAILQALELDDLVVRYTDRAGRVKIIATPSEPMELQLDFRTATRGPELGYYFSLQVRGRQRSYYLSYPTLPQFVIDENGKLIYHEALKDSFSLNAAGALVATGPSEYRYSQDAKGRLIFS